MVRPVPSFAQYFHEELQHAQQQHNSSHRYHSSSDSRTRPYWASSTPPSNHEEFYRSQEQYLNIRRVPRIDPINTHSSHAPPRSTEEHDHGNSPPEQPKTVPLHRVYILRCAGCNAFISDRGMRAVLLLKPNVILFSTDSAPVNSGPLWPSLKGGAKPSHERTCECLTSSLGCYTCGNLIGYHIVQPCLRCTASVYKHQRAANHHRYVFHHNEVTYQERRYLGDREGVQGPRYVPASSSQTTNPTSPVTLEADQNSRTPTPTNARVSSQIHYSKDGPTHTTIISRGSSPPIVTSRPSSSSSSRTLTPEVPWEKFLTPDASIPQEDQPQLISYVELCSSPHTELDPSSPTFSELDLDLEQDLPALFPPLNPTLQLPPSDTSLRIGDLIYWHNLVSGGERGIPIDPLERTKLAASDLNRIGR